MTVEPRYPIDFLAAALVVTVHGEGGFTDVVRAAPDARALADLAKAAHTLQRLVIDVDRHDNRADEGAAVVDEWLLSIVGEAAG